MSLSTKDSNRLERVRYFPRQLMTAEDMRAEQDYFVERLRRHNRLLHGWGIICGLQVLPDATADQPWRVEVCPGSACAATGDEIHVPREVWFDLARPPETDGDCVPCPCPPGPPLGTSTAGLTTYYLAIRYLCRPARPVRTGHVNCGCGDEGCETSRWRDDFELALLTELPVPYDETSLEAERTWLEDFKYSLQNKTNLLGLRTRPCSPSSVGPWVILASVRGDLSKPPTGNGSPSDNLAAFLKEDLRRPLPCVQDLLCFHLAI